MIYAARIQAEQHSPQGLEALHGAAVQEGGAAEFRADLEAAYASAPDNILLQAWHYRLAAASAEGGTAMPQPSRRPVNWRLVIALSLATGLLLWWLSGPAFAFDLGGGKSEPYLTILATPLLALVGLVFFATSGPQGARLPIMLGAVLAAVTGFAMWRAMSDNAYRELAITHMPLLAWAAAGVCLTGVRASAANRFAFLAKSIEVTVVTGLYAGATMIFAGISMQMFKTLGVTLSDALMRLLTVGGVGLMPMVAIASTYDPSVPASAQDFRRGLSRVVSMLPRLLLVLTLLVLAVYIALIPANFMQPFRDREVLIIYNVMLFAVMGMLIGATPVSADDLSETYQQWLRRGIVAVAALVLLVGLYALAAVLYRTVQDHLTLNRLTIIGWNVINIGVLAHLLVGQRAAGGARWIDALHTTFRAATVAYAGWAAFVVLGVRWFF